MHKFLYKSEAGVIYIGFLTSIPQELRDVVKFHVSSSTEPRPPILLYVPYSDLQELHSR